ncbi:hypothetical protein [Halogeometricum sp. CBA1124]|uniref:hypothetical protein n=1 Tax=Halogeometricum sp. CBA1124 TaxID=2668071 RepID=UPI001429706C|nr:hypothetical protein [Halogeometricum sp. CBA1124]MUV57228.1 hypothetical protein [Halogeometricum sp. CBA1124]
MTNDEPHDDPLEPTDAQPDEQTDHPSRLEQAKRRIDFEYDDSNAKRAADGLARVARVILDGWAVFVLTLFFKILSFVPKSGVLGDKFIDAGYKLKLKTTSADTIINVIYGDGMVIPRAAEWHTTENEYRLNDGKAYKSDQLTAPRLVNGKYPTVWTLAEAAEIMDPIAAYTAGQRRRGNYDQHLRTDGAGKDVAIHAETEGYDGRAISFRDAYRLFGSNVSQEDMNLQATRAKLAEIDFSTRQQVMMVLIFAGGVALGLFGPALAQSIAGGGGGGGIGVSLPLFLGVPF